MGRTEELTKRFGGKIREIIGGVDGAAPAPAIAALAAGVGPEEGKTRDWTAGHLQLDRIVPDPGQPRKTFDGIEELAASVAAVGVLEALRVRWDASLGKYVIITGERRYRAARQVGLEKVPVRIVDRELTLAEIRAEQLIENLLRDDLKPCQKAQGLGDLMELRGWNATQLAADLHISDPSVSDAFALLRLPEDLRRQIDRGELSATAGVELAKLDTEQEQRELALQFSGARNSSKSVRAAVKDRRKGGKGGSSNRGEHAEPAAGETFHRDSAKARGSIAFKRPTGPLKDGLNELRTELAAWLEDVEKAIAGRETAASTRDEAA